MIKAYIHHICCPFRPSKKILMDNGTEFKNKLWTDIFDKLKTEQKFTPIYSPQCNGRIKGFHKFLKATIAKQLETHVECDDLVWKATAAYNFIPTESSGMAPFFLIFRCEATVKHRKSKISGNRRWHDQYRTDDQALHGRSIQPKPGKEG